VENVSQAFWRFTPAHSHFAGFAFLPGASCGPGGGDVRLGIPLWLQLLLFLFGFLLFGWFSAFGESLWALAYLDLRPQAARAGEGISTATG
jgi:hypothetical protein